MRSRLRKPTLPGEVLQEEFLVPMGMTQSQLAQKVGCEVKAINRLVNGRTALRAPMALALAEVFGTTPNFWLNLQNAVDLFEAQAQREAMG